jgi:hypothetical protein
MVGNLCGFVVEMPYAEATACLSCGTARALLPEEEGTPTGARPVAAPKAPAVPATAPSDLFAAAVNETDPVSPAAAEPDAAEDTAPEAAPAAKTGRAARRKTKGRP